MASLSFTEIVTLSPFKRLIISEKSFASIAVEPFSETSAEIGADLMLISRSLAVRVRVSS